MKNTELGILSVSGIDAKKFLQGQVTCNMDEVTEQAFRFAAHCNPQGRIISFFRVFLSEQNYLLVMPNDLLEMALKAFKKYAIFFKVNLSIVNTLTNISVENYPLIDDIQSGIPRIYATTSGKFLPHELNLQLINAISFNKGCYTGQEIIARMHYRGQLKNHMYRGFIETNSINENELEGNLVAACHVANGMEILFVANQNDIATKELFVNEIIPIKILSLPYSFS